MRHRFNLAFILLSLLFCCQTVIASSDDDYQQGLAAYIKGDYATAHGAWLKAAELKDPRAMFNIGLLHEQRRIANASSENADNWFIRASKHGYSAADYHLGMRWLAQGGMDEEANARLARASAAGYAPAKRRLGGQSTGQEKSADRTVEQQSRGGNSKYLTEAWISAKPESSWTIQLLAFSDRIKVESFISEHSLERKAAYFAEKVSGEVLFKLIYGSYDSKDKAEFARQNLPNKLREHGPWLRSISSVQSVIVAQK